MHVDGTYVSFLSSPRLLHVIFLTVCLYRYNVKLPERLRDRQSGKIHPVFR